MCDKAWCDFARIGVEWVLSARLDAMVFVALD
jgi:hypothetical protein